MKETVISWTAPNFGSIGAMLILWGVIIGLVCKMWSKYQSGKSS